MRRMLATMIFGLVAVVGFAQDPTTWLSTLPQAKEYVQKRSSSYDRSGGNADARSVAPGETLTLLDDVGPGLITHVWFTIASDDPDHLKALVLRMYWDGESTPSVEAPVGDFFGLGLGDYHLYQSIPLSVGSDKALNCFFPMPFQKHALITVTNEGSIKTDAFYFNIDYRSYSKPLPADQLYFHAQYRQAAPAKGTTTDWKSNGDMDGKKNLRGEDNYVWMEAAGRGHFVGVTMSVLQNQDKWWGEGDDMFFVDGEKLPSINGTGSEDYFSGSMGFWRASVCLRFVRRPCRGGGSCRRAIVCLSISSGFADPVYEISAGDDRARARESQVRQFLFGGVLVPGRTPCCVSRAAGAGAKDSKNLWRRRAGECEEVARVRHSMNLKRNRYSND